jgi:LPS O-antigen subunit length determinant protein (WzzB/FepE family)
MKKIHDAESFSIELAELVHILRVGWRASVLTVILVAAIAVIYALLQPRLYQAQSVLVAPRNLELAALSVPQVQGVHLVDNQICKPFPEHQRTTFVVTGDLDIPCVAPSSVFFEFASELEDVQHANRSAQAPWGAATNSKIVLDDDHGYFTVSIRAASDRQAGKLLHALIFNATKKAKAYFLKMTQARIDQRIALLSHTKDSIVEEAEKRDGEVVAKLEMALNLFDSRSSLEKTANSSVGDSAGVSVRIVIEDAFELVLEKRSAVATYLELIKDREVDSYTQREIGKIENEISRLKALRKQSLNFSVNRVMQPVSVSDRPVEPNYLLIALPSAIIGVLGALFAGFVRYYFVFNRKSD